MRQRVNFRKEEECLENHCQSVQIREKNMIKHVRLERELAKLASSDSKDICVFPKDDKLDVLEAQIVGPEKSPYQSGVFKVFLHLIIFHGNSTNWSS